MRRLKVLITNGGDLRSLIFIRSVAHCPDIELHVSAERRLAAGFHSRFCRHKTINVNPVKNPQLFIKQMIDYIAGNNIDVFIPISSAEINETLIYKNLFPETLIIPYVDHDTFCFANDKWKFNELAEMLKIPVPATIKIEDFSELDNVNLKYPLLVKARTGAGSKAILKVENQFQLPIAFKHIIERYKLKKDMYPLIQEYIEDGEYVCAGALCRKGTVKSVSVYKSLRQYPLDCGTATAKVTTKDLEIEEKVRLILFHLKWHGIAQFDMIRKNGRLYFLEMNPRLYTSINITVQSGLNYPYFLCRLGEDIDIPRHYHAGVYSRIFLADTLVFLLSLFKKRKYPPGDYLAIGKKMHTDDMNLSDPLPSIHLLIKFMRGTLI